jgi:hypothetical protein
MDFLFYVPFFYTAAAVAEILTVYFVNIEFRECKKLILNHVRKFLNFVQILLVVWQNCPIQLDVKKQSLIRGHCSIVTVP